jgi:uncharacterized membrane protein HdeD (DUF308 family)
MAPGSAVRRSLRHSPTRRRRSPKGAFLLLHSPLSSFHHNTEDEMSSENSYTTRKQMMWGLVLIAVGVVFLLDRMYIIEAESLWHYWPLLLVVAGINQTIGYPSARQFRNGLWTIFTGLWLFAVFEGLFGLTFRNSWPLFLLMWGVLLVLTPVFRRRFPQSKEHDHA